MDWYLSQEDTTYSTGMSHKIWVIVVSLDHYLFEKVPKLKIQMKVTNVQQVWFYVSISSGRSSNVPCSRTWFQNPKKISPSFNAFLFFRWAITFNLSFSQNWCAILQRLKMLKSCIVAGTGKTAIEYISSCAISDVSWPKKT